MQGRGVWLKKFTGRCVQQALLCAGSWPPAFPGCCLPSLATRLVCCCCCCAQIWENKTQWRGFLLCCEKLQEQGSPLVLLQLPENILEQALGGVSHS